MGLDERVVFAEGGGTGEDKAGQEGQLPGDGEGGLLTGELVASAAEFPDVGADSWVRVEAGGGAVGGFAFGGAVAGEEVGFRGGVAFGYFFRECLSTSLEFSFTHGTCLYNKPI